MQKFKKLSQTLLKAGLLFLIIFDFGIFLKAQNMEDSLNWLNTQNIKHFQNNLKPKKVRICFVY
jgi:hypothetical protein